MPHATTGPYPGLQALILCGPGSSFSTFMSNPDENPKALLPVANRPMVWYPIDFCYRMGITGISLICPASAAQTISTAVRTNPFLTSFSHPKVDIIAPKDLSQTTGTAELLRLPEVKKVIKSDFLVLPCDLVCALPGEMLLQAWMTNAAGLNNILDRKDGVGSDGSLLGEQSPSVNDNFSGGLSVWFETKTELAVKGEETDFVVLTPLSTDPKKARYSSSNNTIAPHISQIVQSMPKDTLKDVMAEREGIPIRHQLLAKYPRVRMLTSYRDAHIYIFPQWIVDFVERNPALDSIGEDVLGWWAKACWQEGMPNKLHLDEILDIFDEDDIPSTPASQESHSDVEHSDETSSANPVRVKLAPQPPPKSKDSTRRLSTSQVPPLLAYVQPHEASSPLIRRVDNAKILLTVSQQLAKLPSVEECGVNGASPFAHQRKVAYPEGVASRTTITKDDCLLADNVMIQEKVIIKETTVGANCQINEGSRVHQSLLMDGAIVGKNCKLTRCILGKRCVIGDDTELTDCEVQENLMVEAKAVYKDEKLMSSEGLEATEEEMEAIYGDE